MKKLIQFIGLLFVSTIAISQPGKTPSSTTGSVTETVKVKGGWAIDSALIIPVKDTTFHPYRAGALTFRPQNGKMYLYDSVTAGKKWVALLTSTDPWLTTGNNGTDTSVNFLGPIDVAQLQFRAQNNPMGWLDAANDNVSFGYHSYQPRGTSADNVALGGTALQAMTDGYNNIGIGQNSLKGIHDGNRNIGVGKDAGLANVSGSDNMYLGNFAGKYMHDSAGYLVFNMLDQNNVTGDMTKSPIVIKQDANPALTDIILNGKINARLLPAGVGIKQMRYNPSTGDVSYADTAATAISAWQQTINVSNNNSSKLNFDTTMTVTDSTVATKEWMEFKPIVKGDGTPSFYWNMGVQKYPGVAQSDHIWNMGWNLGAGGGQQTPGQPGIGYQLEQRYIPLVGDTNTEAHLFYITKAGVQKRLFSYTIKEYLDNYDFYHTISRMSLISPVNPNHQYFEVEPHSLSFRNIDGGGYDMSGSINGVAIVNVPSATQGSAFNISNFTGANIPTINSYSSGANNSLTLSDNASNILVQLTASPSTVGLTTYTNNTIEINPNNVTAISFTQKYSKIDNALGIGTIPATGNKVHILCADSLVALRVSNTHGSGNNYGVQSVTDGGGPLNVGGYFSAFNGATNEAVRIDLPNAGANNYAILSNSSAKSGFAGSVGVGIVDPDVTFHVVGGLKFVTGNQGTAKVLVSDASGGADWATASSLGLVSSVSGTTNRITSTGGTTPVIDISASYVGQSSLTTLGTIGTGVWQGTSVGSIYGGTGTNSGSSTGIAQLSSGAWSFSTALANGTTATTQSPGDNTTKPATTAFVTAAVAAAGGVTGSGTTNSVARWTSSSALGAGIITDNNAIVSVTPTVTTGTTTSSGISVVANSLTSGTTMNISSSSATTGTLMNLSNANGSSTGTPFTINTATGFTGNAMEYLLNGNSRFSVNQIGSITSGGRMTIGSVFGGSSIGLYIQNAGTTKWSIRNDAGNLGDGLNIINGGGAVFMEMDQIKGGTSFTPTVTTGTGLNGAALYLGVNSLTTGEVIDITSSSATTGTGLIMKMPTGYTGNYIDLQLNAVSKFSVSSAGNATIGGTLGVTGVVTLTNLAGTGSRAVLADASGVLSAPVSDRNVKESINDLDYGLNTIMALHPVSFYYKKKWQNYGTRKQVGFIAQEVESVMPNSVFTTPSTGLKGYNESDIIPVLCKAIQEQQKQIDTLKKQLKEKKK